MPFRDCSLAGFLLSAAAVGCSRTHPQLVLTEEEVWVLDDTMRIAGATYTNAYGPIVWTPHSVLSLQKGKRRVCRDQPLSPIAVGEGGRGELLILDKLAGVLVADSSGKCAIVASLPTRFRAQYAVATPSGWVLAGSDSMNRVAVLAVDSAFKPRWLKELPSYFADSSGPALWLSPSIAGQVIIASLQLPQRIVIIATESGSTVHDLALPPVDNEPPERWIGLTAIGVDSGILVTHADLASDERRLLLYTHGGQFVRATVVDAPLGFLARRRGLPVALAVRRTDSLELVKYSWSWKASQ